MSTHENSGEDRTGHFANYAEYNKTIRTWFVTFGIGGPLVLLANPVLTEKLVKASALAWVVYPFLAACAVQIIVAMINKASSWYSYYFAGSDKKQNEFQKLMIGLGDWYRIDLGADVATFLLFAFAVFEMVSALL